MLASIVRSPPLHRTAAQNAIGPVPAPDTCSLNSRQLLAAAAVTGTADQMQVSDLVGPMLNVLQPEHRALCIANPRPFGGVARLLRSVARAGFLDVRSR